jgi:hypothetical protein
MSLQPRTGYVNDDGLVVPEVGVWAEEKYRIIELYDALFSSGMKRKWDCRVYIDLFSAAGHAKTKEQTALFRDLLL